MPIVVLSEADFYSIREGDYITVEPDGSVYAGKMPALPGY